MEPHLGICFVSSRMLAHAPQNEAIITLGFYLLVCFLILSFSYKNFLSLYSSFVSTDVEIGKM